MPAMMAALLLSGGVMVGAFGAAAGYWVFQQDHAEQFVHGTYQVELAPTGPGAFHVLLPVPTGSGGQASTLVLRVLHGNPEFALARTPHGLALSVKASEPVKLEAEGPLPVHLSLDDVAYRFRQFSFWTFLDPGADAPVLLKLEVRQRIHRADWDLHVDNGKAILVQDTLQPEGWQVLRATQLFEVQAWEGYGAGFPRIALGAATVSLASLYGPLGLVVMGAFRQRRDGSPEDPSGREGFM